MKKRRIIAVAVAVVAALGVFSLAACKSKDDTLSADEASEIIETYTGTPTSVSGTFVQDFLLDVDSDNVSFQAYAKDLKSTVDFTINFASGDVYMYAKKTDVNRADGNSQTVTESILAKENGTYSYATTSTPKTELATQSDSAALDQVNTLFKSITNETAGWLTTSAFVYTGYDWVQEFVLLGSSSVDASNSRYFAYSYKKNGSNGLEIGLENLYVGYTGDSGTIDIGTDGNHTGGTATIVTDDNGYVTSFEQEMNNEIDFAITTPPVPLYYTGTRTLAATYDGSVSKKNIADVNAEEGGVAASTSAITVYPNENCSVVTYDFALGDYSTLNTASDIVTAGNYVAALVTPGDGYEVAVVLVNGIKAEEVGGYYCLMEQAEAGTTYNVAVTLKNKGAETGTTGKIIAPTAEEIEHVTNVEIGDFNTGDYQTAWGETVTPEEGHYVAVRVTCEEGYEVKSVTVNGEETTNFSGMYCYMPTPVAGAEYIVEITVGEPGEDEGEARGTSTISVYANSNCTIETYDFDYATFSGLDVESTTVTAGNYVAVKVTPNTGYKVAVVLVNGKTATPVNGYYCYMTKAVADTNYNVAVTLIEENETISETEGTVVAPDATSITGVSSITLGSYSSGTVTTTTGSIDAGSYVSIQVTCDEGYMVSAVTVNGEGTTLMNGWYCYMTPVVAGADYNVEIEIVQYVNVTCETVSGCTIGVYNFNLSAFTGLNAESNVVYVGNYVAVKVTCDDGYSVESVTVYAGDSDTTGSSASYISGYYCYQVKDTDAGQTLKVVVTLTTATD